MSNESQVPNPSPPAAPNRALPLLLGLLLCGILLTGIVALLALRGVLANAQSTPTAEASGGVALLDEPRELMDFTMTSAGGEPIQLRDLRGKWALVFFGFTHCPDFCPLTLAEFTRVKADLEALAQQVNFVFITVDPERDTPAALSSYLSRFDPAFIGMTGDATTLAQISPDYGLYYELRRDEGTNGNYPVDHSTATYIIDPDGRLRAIVSYSAAVDTVTAALRELIEAA